MATIDSAPTTPAPAIQSRYRPEPGELDAPPMVFCIAAGDWRPDCVAGCWNHCWRTADAREEDAGVAPTAVGFDMPF